MDVFWDKQRPRAHDMFTRWQERNPNGYVLNLSSKTRAVLHEVLCPHVAAFSSNPEASLTARPKVCSTDQAALREWVCKTSLEFRRCRNCIG
jgi:hypothetical protein